jgi:hypothetical protein
MCRIVQQELTLKAFSDEKWSDQEQMSPREGRITGERGEWCYFPPPTLAKKRLDSRVLLQAFDCQKDQKSKICDFFKTVLLPSVLSCPEYMGIDVNLNPIRFRFG